MTMDNEQLTAAYNGLVATVRNLTSKLEGLIPQVQMQAQGADDLAKTLDANLKAAVNPLIEANLVQAVQKVEAGMNMLEAARIESAQKIQDVEAKITASAQNASTIDDLRQFVVTMNSSLDKLTKEVGEAKQKAMDEGTKTETRYAQQQQQMATMLSTMSASSGGSGSYASKMSEPFVVHKLILNKTPLSGSESFEQIDEWYSDMANDIELIMPGSKKILKEAERSPVVITQAAIMARDDQVFVSRLSREMFGVLQKKTSGVARNQIKLLDENDGLEAWRLIRLNLCNKDEMHIEAEYKVKCKLPKVSLKEMSGLAELLTRWESEIKRFAAIDPGYDLSHLQKKNAVYEILPEEMQKIIDVETSKPNTNIKRWPEWIEFVKSWSRSFQFQKSFKPTPLTANLIDDNAPRPVEVEPQEEQKFSTDQWIAWLQDEEGKQHIASGLPLPAEGMDALYAVVQKGKGKGGSPKGKGKGFGKNNWQPKGKGKTGGRDGGKSPKGSGKSSNLDSN